MQPAHNYPSASCASPYASFSGRRDAIHMTRVATDVSINNCCPGWTPDYKFIASRIPTLILPSYSIVSIGFTSSLLYIHSTDRLHSPAQYHLNGPMFNLVL